MVLDSDNRVYITTVAGVQVFDAKGQYLGSFKAGRRSGGNSGRDLGRRERRRSILHTGDGPGDQASTHAQARRQLPGDRRAW
jgi:hypothetical protein